MLMESGVLDFIMEMGFEGCPLTCMLGKAILVSPPSTSGCCIELLATPSHVWGSLIQCLSGS